ncbi:hypothetical protein ACPEG4_20300, partial [Escherichia coli]
DQSRVGATVINVSRCFFIKRKIFMFASPAINKQSHFFQLTGTQTITIGYLMKMNTNAEYFTVIMDEMAA